MEHVRQEQASTVPEHLRPFFRPNFTTEPQIQHSYTSPLSTSSRRGGELCPPHWRRTPKRNLRETLKDILLKDWQGTRRHALRRTAIDKHAYRPFIMRMKDSDDYLTARAANPRTGLISPSVGSRTPRIYTPGTPGEALELAAAEQRSASPSPDVTARPPLRRANEGRKTSGESALKWRPDASGWTTDSCIAIASPRVAHIKADAALFTSKSAPALSDDQFVVRMPTAREPQPYAYPGYSSNQIEAFEHYKRKAKRVSGQGYDTRVVNSGYHEDDTGVKVAKRRAPTCDIAADPLESCNCSEASPGPASFAPFSSPKTPKLTTSGASSTAMKTLSGETATRIRRKAVNGAELAKTSTEDKTSNHRSDSVPLRPENVHVVSGAADLRHLPRVTLVHPSCAGIPQPHPHLPRRNRSHESVRARQCSLGCPKDADADICLERRIASNSAPSHGKNSLFDDDDQSSFSAGGIIKIPDSSNEKEEATPLAPQLSELFITALVGAAQACKNVKIPSLPRFGVLDILYAEDTTPQEKVSALRRMLASAGQVVVCLTIVAMLWQIGSLVARIVEIVFWPFMVPLKILRWLGGGG